MVVPGRRSVRDLCGFVSQDLLLWQGFLLFLWLSVLLVHRLSGASLEFLEEWFLSSFPENEPVPAGRSASDDGYFGDPVDSRGSSISVPVDDVGDLIPPLPDTLVQNHVWPLLADCPSVTLLVFLRSVNSSWCRFLETSVEWNALRFLHLDTPGFLECATTDGLPTITVAEQLLRELANYRVLLREDMEEIENRVRYLDMREKRLPM